MFAGTVEAVEAPFLLELDSRTIVRLKVDTVWRGDPPAALFAYTGGPCGTITPAPGTPFLACEDDTGDISWMALGWCGHPRFGEAPEIRTTLGPGHAPTAAPVLRWQWWHTKQVSLSLASVLALPLLGTMLGAALGRWDRRRAARAPEAARSPMRGLLLLAAAIVAARLCLRATLPDDYYMRAAASEHHGSIVMVATIVIAALVGLWLGYRGQRRPGRHGPWRGLAVAFIGVGLMLVAGLARLHVPIQPADAVACSAARAREFLRTAPIRQDTREDEDDEWDQSPTAIAGGAEALRIAYDAVPYACADWGLRRMRFDPFLKTCLEYEDGLGGIYHQCVDPSEDRYTVEGPG